MNIIKKYIAANLSKIIQIDIDEIFALLTIPPKTGMGDLAFPCFKLAAKLSKSPAKIAEELLVQSKDLFKGSDLIFDIKAFGPYLNFFIDRVSFVRQIISEIQEKKEKSFTLPSNNKCVVIDYSSPNIAKPIAFHHIRSTVIGNIIANIFEASGYNVVRINYLGDWGTQFGKLITAFEEFGDSETLNNEGIKHLLDIYVEYHKVADEDMELKAREWFKKTEEGDEKALSYWKLFRDISVSEFNRIYKRLNVKFTNIEGESFYNRQLDKLVSEIGNTIGTEESEGAIIINMDRYDMPPVLLKKSDGSTLYATRDLAAAIDRWNRFSFDESLYVVAHQQELHFKQIFKVLQLLNNEWSDRCKHIAFGLLHLEDSKMSSREGNIIFLEEVLEKSVELAKKAIEQKNPDLESKDEVAEAVGVGAIIFNDISKRRIQNITFKWDEILNFDGETAPYVQYTYARACSILKKLDFDINNTFYFKDYIPNEIEFEIVKHISSFHEKLDDAKREYEPFILARYTLDLCKLFNRYYYQEKIIDIENINHRNSKLCIIYSVKELIAFSLNIMGIQAPERM